MKQSLRIENTKIKRVVGYIDKEAIRGTLTGEAAIIGSGNYFILRLC